MFKKVQVKNRKKVDEDVMVVYWNSEGKLFNGWAEVYDDGTALIECSNGEHCKREAGNWLRMLDYKIVSGAFAKRAVEMAKERYGKK